MKVKRTIELETNDIQIGDQICVSHYTATCQEITSIAAIFLLDQYLDKPMAMNVVDTNSGGYPESDLRKALQGDDWWEGSSSWGRTVVPRVYLWVAGLNMAVDQLDEAGLLSEED